MGKAVHHISGKLEIGSILTTADFLQNRFRSDKVFLHLPTALVVRRDDEYKEFYLDLCEKLMPDVKVLWGSDKCRVCKKEHIVTEDFFWISPNKIKRIKNVDAIESMTIPDFSGIMCGGVASEGSKTTAVLTTRVKVGKPLNVRRPMYSRIQLLFQKYGKMAFEKMVDKYDKVVIIGGKDEDMGDRQTGEKQATEIYRTISQSKAFSASNVEDRTTTNFDITQFYRENALCKFAGKVVTFGIGGNFVRQLYLKTNHLALLEQDQTFHPLVKHPKVGEHSKIYDERSFKLFLDNI